MGYDLDGVGSAVCSGRIVGGRVVIKEVLFTALEQKGYRLSIYQRQNGAESTDPVVFQKKSGVLTIEDVKHIMSRLRENHDPEAIRQDYL